MNNKMQGTREFSVLEYRFQQVRALFSLLMNVCSEKKSIYICFDFGVVQKAEVTDSRAKESTTC